MSGIDKQSSASRPHSSARCASPSRIEARAFATRASGSHQGRQDEQVRDSHGRRKDLARGPAAAPPQHPQARLRHAGAAASGGVPVEPAHLRASSTTWPGARSLPPRTSRPTRAAGRLHQGRPRAGGGPSSGAARQGCRRHRRGLRSRGFQYRGRCGPSLPPRARKGWSSDANPRGGRGERGGGRRERRRGDADEDTPEFIEKLALINRVAKVVKGGRSFFVHCHCGRRRRRARVGFGTGRANEVPEAIRKGGAIARRRDVPGADARRHSPAMTTARDLQGLEGRASWPASAGTGLIAGVRCARWMEAAGARDALTKSPGSDNWLTRRAPRLRLRAGRAAPRPSLERGAFSSPRRRPAGVAALPQLPRNRPAVRHLLRPRLVREADVR